MVSADGRICDITVLREKPGASLKSSGAQQKSQKEDLFQKAFVVGFLLYAAPGWVR
jgi:hypothetical protein